MKETLKDAERHIRRIRKSMFSAKPAAVKTVTSSENGWQSESDPVIRNAVNTKLSYAKSVFSAGKLPNNFSINLGAAACNHACLFCPQSVEKPSSPQWLDLDLLRKVLEEMPEEGILLNLSSYTETIAAPNLIPAVKLMKTVRPKLQIAMASNGSVFREQVIEELIDLGLDHYSYSFDSANPEQYAVMMQKDDFQRVWDNLEKLVALRERKGSKMKITTHIMHFKGVEEDFERFKAHWENKIDLVYLRRVGNWGDDGLGLMKRMEELGFVSAHETPKERFPCPSIFMSFKLQFDGQYYPCVSAIPAYDKHLVPPVGNARENTWMEAWERLSEMRQAHLEGRWDDYECCKTCNIWSMWDNFWFQETNLDSSKTPFYVPGVEHAQ